MFPNFIAYILIPVYTLLLAGGDGWLTSNFSLIGSQGIHRLAFIGWGVLIGLFFHLRLGRLIDDLEGGRWFRWGRWLAIILFFLSLATPYLPDSRPLQAELHVLLALVATLILFFLVLTLLLRYRTRLGERARPYLLSMAVIGAVVALLLALAGIVSTGLEVFLVLSNVILLQQMTRLEGA